MPRAPCAAAISRVPSLEPASTTSTSVTRDAGISSRTRAIEPASLYVGMTTLTRIPKGLSEAPAWVAAREHGVHAPGSSGTCPGEAEGENAWNPQLPDPGGAELRNPVGDGPHCGDSGSKACASAG